MGCHGLPAQERANSTAGRSAWARIGDKKAWTLPGSEAAWPIGLREASSFSAIALVEGGPDLLAMFHLAWSAGVEDRIAAVAMMGAGYRIPEDAFLSSPESGFESFRTMTRRATMPGSGGPHN